MQVPTPVQEREAWSSSVGFLAAAIGSAVGIGNLWRFSYMTGQNGGASFLIAYVVALAVCGGPLLMYEIAAGRHYRKGIVGATRAIDVRLWPVGAGVALIGFTLLSYYLVITGWAMGYLVSLAGGRDSSFDIFTASWTPVACFLAAGVVTLLIVLRGVQSGIEASSKFLLPVLVGIVLLLAVYGATQPGFGEALAFLLKPDVSYLFLPATWAGAFGQAFFSLGVGMGVLLTYGSYQQARTPVIGPATVVAGVDTLIALLAGLAVFPLVFSLGLSPAAGPSLAFDTLRTVFHTMQFGLVLGTAFYLLLTIAAVTSAVSMLEMVTAALRDWLGWSRRRSLLTAAVPLLGLGMLSALSYSPLELRLFGMRIFDLLDAGVGTFGLLLGALAVSVAIFWFGDARGLIDQVGGQTGIGRRLSVVSYSLGRYVIPVVIVATLGSFALRFF